MLYCLSVSQEEIKSKIPVTVKLSADRDLFSKRYKGKCKDVVQDIQHKVIISST